VDIPDKHVRGQIFDYPVNPEGWRVFRRRTRLGRITNVVAASQDAPGR